MTCAVRVSSSATLITYATVESVRRTGYSFDSWARKAGAPGEELWSGYSVPPGHAKGTCDKHLAFGNELNCAAENLGLVCSTSETEYNDCNRKCRYIKAGHREKHEVEHKQKNDIRQSAEEPYVNIYQMFDKTGIIHLVRW